MYFYQDVHTHNITICQNMYMYICVCIHLCVCACVLRVCVCAFVRVCIGLHIESLQHCRILVLSVMCCTVMLVRHPKRTVPTCLLRDSLYIHACCASKSMQAHSYLFCIHPNRRIGIPITIPGDLCLRLSIYLPCSSTVPPRVPRHSGK